MLTYTKERRYRKTGRETDSCSRKRWTNVSEVSYNSSTTTTNKLFADLATVLTALQHRTAFPVVNVETFFGELFVTLATEYAQAARQSSFNNIQGRFARRPWRPMQRRAFPLRHWIRRELDSIKLEYDPRRPDDRLILTASTFNWLQPWRQQSWSQGICRTRRFFPSSGRNHRQYSLHLPT